MSAFDEILRLIIAVAAGIAIGFNLELRQKPLGMRTLGSAWRACWPASASSAPGR